MAAKELKSGNSHATLKGIFGSHNDDLREATPRKNLIEIVELVVFAVFSKVVRSPFPSRSHRRRQSKGARLPAAFSASPFADISRHLTSYLKLSIFQRESKP